MYGLEPIDYSGKRSALKQGGGAESPLVGIDERYDLVKQLAKNATSESERQSLATYTDQLLGMERKLLDRSDLLKDYKRVKDEIARLYKEERKKSPGSKKARASNLEIKRLREEKAVLEERIELLDGEISRRDEELFSLAAMRPIREMVKRVYQIGVDDGLVSRVTPGVIQKRIATMMHAKSFLNRKEVSMKNRTFLRITSESRMPRRSRREVKNARMKSQHEALYRHFY